jgi:hypothetical protein
MYIGGTDEKALHHLFAEVIDNAMDEALAGHATFIEVDLAADGTLAVTDNGRGIPVDPHPKFTKKSALEVVMCTLHAGGKFDSNVYETSGAQSGDHHAGRQRHPRRQSGGAGIRARCPPSPQTRSSPARQSISSKVSVATSLARKPSLASIIKMELSLRPMATIATGVPAGTNNRARGNRGGGPVRAGRGRLRGHRRLFPLSSLL